MLTSGGLPFFTPVPRAWWWGSVVLGVGTAGGDGSGVGEGEQPADPPGDGVFAHRRIGPGTELFEGGLRVGAIAGSLRHELAPADIKIALIEPGVLKTPIWDKTLVLIDEGKRARRMAFRPITSCTWALVVPNGEGLLQEIDR